MHGSAVEPAGGYEPPTIVDYGDLTELTRANNTGNFTDQSFPVHTPKSQLTFS